MQVDALDLVRLNEDIVVDSVVERPRISRLILKRREDARQGVLGDLNDSRRMDNHKVDGVGGRSRELVTAIGLSIGSAVIQSDARAEASLRYANNPHTVVDLDLFVDIVLVGEITGDLRLESGISLLGNEENSSVKRNFVVTHRSLGGINESGNIGSANGDVGGCAGVDSARSGEFAESVSV